MQPERFFQQLHKHPLGRTGLHLLLWLFYFSAQYYISTIQLDHIPDRIGLRAALKNTLSVMLVYYPLVYRVVPRYWMRKKYLAGMLATALLVLVYALADFALEQLFIVHCRSCMEELQTKAPNYYHFMQQDSLAILSGRVLTLGIVYQLFVFICLPVFIKIAMAYLQQYIQKISLQAENVQLEFNFLKAQVHPHFLFNTLNNIYALILQDRKNESAETVARLSHFMRYTLYDCDNHTNVVLKEIGLLKDFIALEQIRLNNTTVNFTYDTDSEAYRLPPLLFMPAVENAFKYCAPGDNGNSFIFIHLEIKNHRLVFSLSNTCHAQQYQPRTGGIGLRNLQKRLAQYYPGEQHQMKTSRDEDVYKMHIHINLNHD